MQTQVPANQQCNCAVSEERVFELRAVKTSERQSLWRNWPYSFTLPRTLIDQISFGFPIYRTWSFLSSAASSSTILIYLEDEGSIVLRTSEFAPISRLRNPIEDYQIVNRRLLMEGYQSDILNHRHYNDLKIVFGCRGTALEAGSRWSLGFFIVLILPAAVWFWNRLSL